VAEALIGQFGYLGIIALLVLGGLGLPVPEEAPIILAAILSRKGTLYGPLAFGACVAGVLLGDFLVYGLGYYYGERVLSFRFTRKFLTKARETQIKGYFERHGLKILVLGRFAVGFRTAAYLTAGILRHPPLRLLLTDLVAVSLSTPLMFALGWAFAHQIEAGIREVQHYIALILAAGIVGWIAYRYYKARKRGGRPIGPPVLDRVVPPPPSPSAVLRLTDEERRALEETTRRARRTARPPLPRPPVPAPDPSPAPGQPAEPPLLRGS
jgi:membrane protein DedA with SNARE-associated domain